MAVSVVGAPQARTVLVVEKEAIIRMDLVDELRTHGLDVLDAAGVDEAIKLIRSCPDLHGATLQGAPLNVGARGGTSEYELAHVVHGHRPGCTLVIASGGDRTRPQANERRVLVEPKPYDPARITAMLKDDGRNVGLGPA